ncbi:MAG: hypothetical protein AAGI08_05810 [Bacteroidota bacterium]
MRLLALALVAMVWSTASAQEGKPGENVLYLIEGGFRKAASAQLVIASFDLTGNARIEQDLGTLTWRVGGWWPRKILVSTTVPGQSYGLTVEGRNAERGIPTGSVELVDGMLPRDFVRDIRPGNAQGRATLRYTATANITQMAGEDNHIVTYTLTYQ